MQNLKVQFPLSLKLRRIGKIQKYLILVVLIFAAIPVFAAEISFVAKTNEVAAGRQFQIDVLLNTENEKINAVEGKIVFPQELLELQTIKDGNSIINFWIERPRVESDNPIVFSGITPGGYKGRDGLLFSLAFRAIKNGSGIIEVSDIKALKNDGKGTAVGTRTHGFQFLISQEAPEIQPIEIKDADSPESFAPEIANDLALFDGKWFLVFATQDKGTGIDHYEVKETKQKILKVFSKWVLAESPYLLKDQELRSYIFVKAIDKAGNTRIVKLIPQNPLSWYENYENWLIIILGLAIAYVMRKFVWRKCSK